MIPGHQPTATGATMRARRTIAMVVGILCLIASSLVPGVARATQSIVPLNTANGYSVLAGNAITNTGRTILAGSLGISPGTSISGFPPGMVTGSIHNNDSAATTAQADLTAAYQDAASRAPTAEISGDLAGRTFSAGVYHTAAALSLSTNLTLDAGNDPNAVFIFQVEGALNTAAATRIVLANGAQVSQVFWQVRGAVTMGAQSAFIGSILGFAAITVGASTAIYGRLLSINGSVTLSSNPINPTTPVALGEAFEYSILAATSVTNQGSSTFSAGVGVAPGSTVTGFPPGVAVGGIHLDDDSAAQAHIDLAAAYTDASGRTPTATLPANLGASSLTAGVYRSTGDVKLNTDLTLDAQSNPNSVFIIQIRGKLTTGAFSRVTLRNGTNPDLVFWQVLGGVSLGKSSAFAGTVLGGASVSIGSGASMSGRALSTGSSVNIADMSMNTLTVVNLRTLAKYSILGGTSVDNSGPTVLNFNVGVIPGGIISGFPPGTSTDGEIHYGDADAVQANADAWDAYNDADQRTATSTVAGDLGGSTLHSGIFSSAGALSLTGNLVLDGQSDPSSVFIFKVAAAFSTAAGSAIQLINGAQANRVFWQVAGAFTGGAQSSFAGSLVSPAAITLGANTTIDGRAVSLNGAVTLHTSAVSSPTTPPGTLTATTAGADLTSVRIDGKNTLFATGNSEGWSIADLRGTGTAWTISVSATDFSSDAGTVETKPRTLPASSLVITPGPITAGIDTINPNGLVSSVVILSGDAQSLVTNPTDHRGTYYFVPTFSLAIPPNAFRSNYQGEIGTSSVNPYITQLTITIS